METARLRGHHIEAFMLYIYWAETKPLWQPFPASFYRDYGQAFMKNKLKLFERLYASPDSVIEIIGEFDDMCGPDGANCDVKKREGCETTADYDRIVARQLGRFCIGRKYRSQDFIDIVRERKGLPRKKCGE